MKELFAEIASVYDRMNRVLSLGRDAVWRRRAVALVKGSPSEILDVACGTGEFAFELAKRFPRAEITGVDFTPGMLELAREKNGSLKIGFLEGDAHDLTQLRTARYDLYSCAFGFRNFADRATALREAHRLLAPGGELLVLEFFRSRFPPLAWITRLWLRFVTPFFARGHAQAYAYLRRSIRRTLTVREFVALAQEAGFRLEQHRFFFPCCTCLRFRSVME